MRPTVVAANRNATVTRLLVLRVCVRQRCVWYLPPGIESCDHLFDLQVAFVDALLVEVVKGECLC